MLNGSNVNVNDLCRFSTASLFLAKRLFTVSLLTHCCNLGCSQRREKGMRKGGGKEGEREYRVA